MEKEINLLKEKFKEIKKQEFCESLRNGTTGIGYTFETLLGKKEDRSYKADFNGIEIKVKLGYSKYPFTLFTLAPKGYDYTIKHILDVYGYPDKDIKEFKVFRANAYHNKNFIAANRYLLKLKVNYELERLQLIILDKFLNILDDSIYWDFDELKNRLFTKLKYLAFVKAYPYRINGETYYKYTNLTIYQLKSFEKFLYLIEKDLIGVCFNIGTCKTNKNYGNIEDRGTAFKLNQENINELFSIVE